MKKTTYLLAIFIALQTFSYAQCPGTPDPGYTCVPDTAFEQALIDFNYDSEAILDGRILTADALAATGSLSLPNKGISDLTGLEAFLNIDAVNLSYNTAITVADLTPNINVTDVNFEGCSSLSTLTVTGLTGLENVNVYGTVLTAIDLSTNIALLLFNAQNSSLGMIDLSANGAVTNVNLRNNNLTSVDMRNGNNANTVFRSDFNSSLTCIFVDDATEPNLGSWIIDGGSTFVETEPACATLSVERANATVFSVFPNPASGMVTIASNLEQDTRLGVYDITGKLVLTNTISFGNNRLNIASLPSGVYLMRVTTNTKSVTKKLVVK
ncbi:MAG: hypothetical protein CMC55_02440 [Flavobacteriaceae bacterium]|uniref:T9SS type A sorting domain-containing protein n=1 Tax=Bizionia echini TaxID=649333 RepID=UPI000C9427BD|nr:hypothetical protein [Flavobacteriaceae bacterium]